MTAASFWVLFVALLLLGHLDAFAHASSLIDGKPNTEEAKAKTIGKIDHSRCIDYEPLVHVSREDVLTASIARRDREKPRAELAAVIKQLADPVTFIATHDGDGDESWDTLTDEYGHSIGQFFGPSVICIVLSLVICPFFCVARCCMANTCCNAHGPYTKCQEWWPLLTYLVFAIIAAVFAGLSASDNVVVMKAITGSMCEVELLADDLQNFAQHVNDPLTAIQASLASATDSFVNATTEAGDFPEFGSNQQLVVLNETLWVAISAVGNAHAQGQHMTKTQSQVQHELNAAHSHLWSTMNEFTVPLAQALDEVQFNLLNNTRDGQHKGLVEVVGFAKSAMQYLHDHVSEESRKQLHEAQDATSHTSSRTLWMTIAFCSVVFFALATGLLMVAAMLSPLPNDRMWAFRLFTCSWSLTYIFMVLMFFVSGIMLPLTVLSEDICYLVADIPNDIPTWGNVSLSLASLHDEKTHFNSVDKHKMAHAFTKQYDNIDAVVWRNEAVGLAEGCFDTPPRGPYTSLGLDRINNLVTNVADVQKLLQLGGGDAADMAAQKKALTNAIERLHGAAIQVAEGLPSVNQVELAFEEVKNQTGDSSSIFDDCASVLCLGEEQQQQRINGGNKALNQECIVSCLPKATQEARSNLIASIRLANARVLLETAVHEIQVNLMKIVEHCIYIGSALITTAPLISKSAEQVSLIAKEDDCEFVKLRFFGIHKQVCDQVLVATGNLSVNTQMIGICAAVMLIMSVLITNRVFEWVFIEGDAKSAMRWVRRVDACQARQLFLESAPSDERVEHPEGHDRYSHPENHHVIDPYAHKGRGGSKVTARVEGIADLLEQQRDQYERELALQREEFERLLMEQRREMMHMQRRNAGQEQEVECLVGSAEQA